MGTDPQQLFGAGLGIENAERVRVAPAVLLERRHADGHRWVQIRRFPARADAEASLEELVRKGGEDRDMFRIRKVG